MRDGSYITIQSWMVTRLHLKGNELMAYALIYGFSQDEQSCFYGSYQYVMAWLNVDRTTAIRVLGSLEKKGLLRKWQEAVNGVMTNRYAAIEEPELSALPDPSQNATGGKMQPVAECNSDPLQNATSTRGKMQPKKSKEKANNNKPRAGARAETDGSDTPADVFIEFANGNQPLLESLREFDQHRCELARKDKKKLWTALAARKICKSLTRLAKEAGVQNVTGYMIASIDQSIQQSWTGVFAVKDFIDHAPAAAHVIPPEPDRPRQITQGMSLEELLLGGGIGS